MEADKGKVLQTANQLAAKGQFDKAIAEWRKLLAESPNDGTIHNNIGDLYIKRNATAEAIEAYLLAGTAFHAAGSALKAIAVYKKILKLDPTRYSVYQQLGDLNAERGLVNNAVSDYLTLSKLYLKDGRTREALAVYRKIVDLDPTNLNARQRLAELCLQENFRDDAVKAYFHLGKECVAQDQLEQAIKAYKTILKIDPGNAKAERLLKDPKTALQEIQPELSRRVGGSESPLEQAQRQMEAGEFEQAETVLSDLLSAQPGDPEVCRLLAMLHVKRGELAVALSEIQFLSEAAIRAEDYGLAESMILEYLKVDQKCVSLLELLGSLYEHKGEHSPAAIQYGKAMSVLLEQPDPEAPDRPAELMGKIRTLDPASPIIADLAAALASPRGVKRSDILPEISGPVTEQPMAHIQPVEALLSENIPPMIAPSAPEPSTFRLAGEQADVSIPASVLPPLSEAAPLIEKEEIAAVAKEPGEANSEALRLVGEALPPALAEPAMAPEEGPAQIAEAAPAPPMYEGTSIPDHEPLSQAPPQVTEHEYRVHYELGMAYKNMGMLDEAVEEFRVAINGKDCFLDASALLAESLKEKGLAELAMECLEQALADARCDEAKAVPIRYELGMLYESDGLLDKAAMIFSSIPAFLDVPMRLERLKRTQASHSSHPSEGESPSGEPTTVAAANAPSTERKKRRISYL
ncbi:MAG TPA: tetratricopeptide repeat protein [Nitrospiraceae bacterium]|nr:tetratricopeptide repeat protein [Nitrospiraceae bacterium]